jgi:FkbM family methyltransferase
MEKLGTNYGGWYLPKNCDLNENSVVYSIGVGEDISFDIHLQSKYKCNIILVDPTKRAILHFEECKKYYEKNKKHKFTGNIQPDYIASIDEMNPDFEKFRYIDIGVWDKKDVLKFYKQPDEQCVSQSLVAKMFTNKFDLVNVDTLRNIMKMLNHDTIDLLKMDIEGAEIVVLNKILDDEIFPKYLCIEFDLFIKKKDKNNVTRKLINRLLKHNYEILINDNMNITFQRKE